MKLSTILVLILAIATLACNSSGTKDTFAGFTFGGGGKTYSAEPAKFRISDSSHSSLSAGTDNDAIHLKLAWDFQEEDLGKQVPLSEANFTVADVAENCQLKEGDIVVQAIDGLIVHGSFDLTVHSADGRSFPVRGSFTAEKFVPPNR